MTTSYVVHSAVLAAWLTSAAGVSAVAAQVVFTEVGAEAGVRRVHDPFGALNAAGAPWQNHSGPGAAWVDLNRDGWLDLILVNGTDPGHYFFLNNGDGSFDDVSAAIGIRTSSAGNAVVACDMDNDGFSDVLFANHFDEPDLLGGGLFKQSYRSGTARLKELFFRLGEEPPGWTGPRNVGIAVADYDNDGWLDFYMVNQITVADRLARNVNGTFTITNLINPTHPGTGFQPIFVDYDDDGDQDIFVINDVSYDFLYRNEGPDNNWAFTEVGNLVKVAGGISYEANKSMGMGGAIADYDNDLDVDFYVTNYNLNTLYQNPGNWEGNPLRKFTEVGAQAGVDFGWNSWGADFFDADNDGDQDLMVIGGWVEEGRNPAQPDDVPNKFYLNNGGPNWTFTDISVTAGVEGGVDNGMVGRGLAVGDYDRDGDLDAVVTNNTYHAPYDLSIQMFEGFSLLYRNDTPPSGNHWVNLRLQGAGVHGEGRGCNRDAVGAKVYVTAGGVTQMRTVQGGSSYQSMNSLEVEFGLGQADMIELVEVIWPCGRTTRHRNQPADRFYHVCEDPKLMRNAPQAFVAFQAQPVRDGIQVEWNTDPSSVWASSQLYRRDGAREPLRRLTVASTTESGRTVAVDEGVTDGIQYEYRLVLIDDLGNTTFSAPVMASFVGPETPLPARVTLGQNYPNPLNPSTLIEFEIPRPMPVELALYDARGRFVRTLFKGTPSVAGRHQAEWDGRNENGREAPSGIYYYNLITEEQTISKKLTLIR